MACAAVVLGALGAAACGGDDPEPAAQETTQDEDGSTQVIMIGDSITEGPYFRPFLLRSLQDVECELDFVGGRTGVTTLNDSEAIAGLDIDHQAIGGAGSTEILQALEVAVVGLEPDIALIYAGTNDVFLDIGRDQTIENVRSMVAVLRSANPQVSIYVAQLMPIAAAEQRTESLNARIGAVAAGLDRPGSAVVAVDMNTGVDAADDLVDGVHPTDSQSEDLAQRWLVAMQPALDRTCTA